MKFALYFLVPVLLSSGCKGRELLSIPKLENEVYLESNRVRLRYGRQSLVVDKRLSRLARRYSCDMGTRRFFSHRDPEERDIRERLWAAGFSFRAAGENLARVKTIFDPRQLLDAWLKSHKHRECLLADYRKTGVGIYCTDLGEYYITQIFTKPFSQKIMMGPK